jgi:hypothetical protein
MKRRLILIVLATLGLCSLQDNLSFGASPLSTVDPSARIDPLDKIGDRNVIYIRHAKSVEFQIISAIGTTGDLYLNGSPNKTSQGGLEVAGFEAEVSSKTSSSYTLKVSPVHPIFNARYPLVVSLNQDGSALELQVEINLDPEAENIFHLDGFSFDCADSINGFSLCTVSSQISGTEYVKEYDSWYTYKLEVSSRPRGSKSWKKTDLFKNQDFPLSHNVQVEMNVSVPTELRATVRYRDRNYAAIGTALPRAEIELSAPGSAIVGNTFTLSLKSNRVNYAGTCKINAGSKGSTSFAVRGGYGKALLYGKFPGNLRLFVYCEANGSWQSTGASRDIYIRG